MARRVVTCPCGLAPAYEQCCGRFHGGEVAPTPELLMRSRFTAFALGDEAYLLRTWHPSTRPESLDVDPALRWSRLEVAGTTGTTVHFRAYYKVGGRGGVQEENSTFVPDGVGWLYLRGEPAP
jgi:SEC-C motif-containing protein